MKKVKRTPVLDGNTAWYQLSPYRDLLEGKTLANQSHYEYVVIGGGFTGLSAARRLAELNPQASIALFDSLKIGQGAAGRNSGFMLDVPTYITAEDFDLERDRKLVEINRFGIKRLKSLVEKHGIDAQWRETGKFLAACHQDNHQKVDDYIKVLNWLDVPYQVYDQQQLSQTMGTPFYTKAVKTLNDVLVNPASLAMGLAKSLPDNVDIYQNTSLSSYQFDAERVLYFGDRKVVAGSVIFATNAFNGELGASDSRLAPMFTYSSMTRPLTEQELASLGDIDSYGLTPAHAAGSTVRFTDDKRLLIRNTLYSTLVSNDRLLDKARDKQRQSLINRFPSLQNVPFEFTWGGNICITLNGKPLFKRLQAYVYSTAGMNGTGIVKGTVLGHYIAEYACGVNSPELDFIRDYAKPSWLPPEPFMGFGAAARLYLEQKIAGREL